MTSVYEDRATEFWHGRKSGIGTSTGVQLTATSRDLTRGVTVVANNGNADSVYLGNSTAVTADSDDATDGEEILPGDRTFIAIDDPTKLYLIAASGTLKVTWRAE